MSSGFTYIRKNKKNDYGESNKDQKNNLHHHEGEEEDNDDDVVKQKIWLHSYQRDFGAIIIHCTSLRRWTNNNNKDK